MVNFDIGVAVLRRSDGRTTPQLVYVQVLRFFAATSVVIFHALGTATHYIASQGSSVFSIFRYGDHGVDLFFVISGFIIYYSTHLSIKSPLSFLARRAERIVPIYWLITLFVVCLSIVFPSAFTSSDWINGPTIIESLLFITFTQGQYPIVYVGWSLEYEMFFYLSVSLLLLRSEKAWDELIIVFSALVVLNIVPSLPSVPFLHDFFTNPIILEFVFGVVIAKIFIGESLSKVAMLALLLGVISVAFMDGASRVLSAGLPSAIVVLLAAVLSVRRAHPSVAEVICARLGDASYSIYLTQGLFISGAFKMIPRLLSLPIDALIAAAAILAVLGGYVVYSTVERPLLKLTRRIRSTPQRMQPSPADSQP
jgi:exopolysaccharide production protein ExoZ